MMNYQFEAMLKIIQETEQLPPDNKMKIFIEMSTCEYSLPIMGT